MPSAFAQRAGQGFVTEQFLDARGKRGAIHPWHDMAVVAVNQPFLDAAGVEGYDGHAVPHRFQAHRAERFRPDRADNGNTAFAVKILQFARTGGV